MRNCEIAEFELVVLSNTKFAISQSRNYAMPIKGATKCSMTFVTP
jgi:hypothetical protein